MKTYWKNQSYWVCPNHLKPVILHHRMPRCTYSSCESRKPIESFLPNDKPKLTIVLQSPKIVKKKKPKFIIGTKCAWSNCKRGLNGSHGFRTERSKYCCVKCKNDNARYRFALRKKLNLVAS